MFWKRIEKLTKRIDKRIQRCVRKLKSKITKDEYSKLYPTCSNPGKFYGPAEIRKRSYNDTIDQLPLGPIVSNIGAASYHLSKYLVKLLSPLSQSECTVKYSKDVIEKFKNVVPLDSNSKLVSTIDVTLRRIYREKEIAVNITPNELKELLLLYTKNVYFFLMDNVIYKKMVLQWGPL